VLPPLRVDVLLPPRGAAEPVLLLPPLDRVDCSSDRRGGSNDDIADEPASGEEGVQPEDVPPPPALDPLLVLLPPLEPPLSPPLGAAEPPPSPPRGTAVPVVSPFEVRPCAHAVLERGIPTTASESATVTILWRVITPPRPKKGISNR
jgi:hypothetical protein